MIRRIACLLFHWPFWAHLSRRCDGYEVDDCTECRVCGDRWVSRG